QEIEPLFYVLGTQGRSFRRIVIQLQPGATSDALAFMERQWATLMPDQPLSYFFLDESYNALYHAEIRMNRILGIFAGLAIFVACLGLFGLAAFTAEQRTKEIGVRKVLGASVPNLILLLSKDFLKLVAIACFIAIPLGYLAAQRWLEDFAYHIDLSVGIFLLASGLAVLIALLTVSYQAIKAALANPIQSLRYE
ncbi:MAG TPA: FtsX-like permease family protein, partial [Rhodothermales bacterium]|nr:FtsX-like permease family protein [Rhodothermales bacterium]